jgi:glucose-1-phosphate cytidylyltransferase
MLKKFVRFLPMAQDIPIFILAGGLGTRISDEANPKPKPMVEIGEIPILVHIMRYYYSYGFNDFVVCAGYRAWDIKNYFINYAFRRNHMVIDHRTVWDSPPASLGLSDEQEKWRVRVIDTGLDCMTGGRLARAMDEVAAYQPFTDFGLTYGDGLSDVDLKAELAYHRKHGKIGTVLGVPPLARFGELDISGDNQVKSFLEKPQSRQGLINGGFFFFKKEFRPYLSEDGSCILEQKPLVTLAADGQLMMHKHTGFWLPMDTPRDKMQLQSLWESGKAPWLPKR